MGGLRRPDAQPPADRRRPRRAGGRSPGVEARLLGLGVAVFMPQEKPAWTVGQVSPQLMEGAGPWGAALQSDRNVIVVEGAGQTTRWCSPRETAGHRRATRSPCWWREPAMWGLRCWASRASRRGWQAWQLAGGEPAGCIRPGCRQSRTATLAWCVLMTRMRTCSGRSRPSCGPCPPRSRALLRSTREASTPLPDHGGRIVAASSPGQGPTFAATLAGLDGTGDHGADLPG